MLPGSHIAARSRRHRPGGGGKHHQQRPGIRGPGRDQSV